MGPVLDRRTCDRASRARDPRFDGRFYIGVTSTRIYCRPVCPAVPPRPDRKRYFPSAAAAAEAGFRPCLRCRPEAAPGTPAWHGTSTTVRRGLALIQQGALDAAGVDALAARLGVGPRHLHRLFVQHLGASPLAVAQTRRLHFAKRLLDETDLPMTEVALAAGFGSLRRFNDAFRATYGRPPSQLRAARRDAPAAADGALRLKLAYRPPYDWTALVGFLGARALPGVERVDGVGDDAVYRRVVRVDGALGTLAVRHRPAARALELELRGLEPRLAFGVVQRVRALFDLAADPAPIAAAFRDDPLLGPCLARAPGLRLPGAFDPFELAVRAVLGQQVSVAAARTFAARLAARHGAPLPAPVGGLSHAFPEPAALARARLAGLGLTSARAATLRALARAVASGALRFDAEPDAVRAALAALPGFGPWTTEYVMLRGVGDPDAFPAGDLGLRQALARSAGAADAAPVAERELAARAEAWRPWRGYAVFHLWRALGATPAPSRPLHKPARARAPVRRRRP